MGGSSTEVEDDAEDDEADDGEHLDEREPELGFAVPFNAEEVDGADGDEELRSENFSEHVCRGIVWQFLLTTEM